MPVIKVTVNEKTYQKLEELSHELFHTPLAALGRSGFDLLLKQWGKTVDVQVQRGGKRERKDNGH